MINKNSINAIIDTMVNKLATTLIAMFIFGALSLIPSFITPCAWGQPAPPTGDQVEQATKALDRDMGEEIEKRMMQVPKGPPKITEEVEPGEPEGPTFPVKKIKLVGVKTFTPEEFQSILVKYENRNVAVSELRILAKEIERDYLRKGVIAACFVPPQEVKDGVVFLRIVEAKMGELIIKDPPYFFKDRIRYYWQMKPGEVLRYDTLSRSLQFMNKNPDRFVKATLHAGKKPETTDVLLEADTSFPIHLTLSFDKEGSVPTGQYRKGIGFVNNNLTGLDDTLMAGYTGGKFFGGFYIYHKVPITNFGTNIFYGFSRSVATPKKDSAAYEMSSLSESLSAYVHQDLFRKDEYQGELKFGFEGKNKSSVWTLGTLNVDKLRLMRVAMFLVGRGMGSVTYLRSEFSQGLNMLGAKRRNEYSSRQAWNTAAKYTLGVTHKASFPGGVRANLKLKTQLATDALVPLEEMYIGGIDSVRGYPSGDFLADTGFFANAEIEIPPFFLPDKLQFGYGASPIKKEITGVLFFDYGYGEKIHGLESERGRAKLASIGVGINWRLFNQATLRMVWGWPLFHNAFPLADPPRTEFANSRYHFSFDFQDRFPEEVKRIYKEMEEGNLKYESWSILNAEMKKPGSPLGAALNRYLYVARKSEDESDFRKAKEYYNKIALAGKSAYRQTENYVKTTIKQRKDLKKQNELALKFYDEGQIGKAKELWEKVREDAKIKPLVIEIL